MNSNFPNLVTLFLAQEAMPVESTNSHFPRLAMPEIVFVFIAFLVVASLISKHFEGRQKLALKRLELGKDDAAGQPALAVKMSSGPSVLVKILIVFFSVFLLLIMFSQFAFFYYSASVPTTRTSDADTTEAFSLATPEDAFAPLPAPTPPKPFVTNLYVPKTGNSTEPAPTVAEAADPVQQFQRIEDWKAKLFFPANRYSGVESCAIPLARMIHEELKSDKKPDEKGSNGPAAQSLLVHVDTLRDFGHAAFLDQFKSAFEKLDPNVKIVDSEAEKNSDEHDQSDQNSDTDYEATFSLNRVNNYVDFFPSGKRELENGEVVCRLQRRGSAEKKRRKTLMASFNEAPWINDFEKFEQLDPSRKIYVGLSESFEQSEDTAHQIAVQDVANQLGLPSLELELDASIYHRTFKQKIIRPYGKVYREAILVIDIGNKFAGQANLTSRAQSRPLELDALRPELSVGGRWSKEIGAERGIAVLAILTVVLSFIANAATQGYYRTRLSRTTVIICSLAVIFILLIVVLNFA